MGVIDLLRSKLGDDIDDDTDKELKRLGKIIHANGGEGGKGEGDEFSEVEHFDAEGGVELFAEAAADDFQIDEATGLFWAPAIRSGQWAVRPGPGQKKIRRPLKVIAGKSKNQRKEIGLQDLLEAFKDNAVEHVTVPTSHENNILDNTGFVEDMKIVDGVHNGKTCKVLMAGYDFTEEEVKEKVKRGTIPNRSCGLLYDYVNTETGKKYPAVIEHIALTAKPWLTGLKAFGKRLRDKLSADAAGAFEGLILSDDDEFDYGEDFDEEAEAFAEVAWDQNESYSFRRDSIQRQLDTLRTEAMGGDFKPPYYYVDDVAGEKALITEGYGRSSRKWVATFGIEDNDVVLAPVIEWKRVREQLVTDDTAAEEEEQELPASYEPGDAVEPEPTTSRDRLALAQAERARGENSLSTLRRRQAELLSGDTELSAQEREQTARALVSAFRVINVSPAPGLLKLAGQATPGQESTHQNGGEAVNDGNGSNQTGGGGAPAAEQPKEDPKVAELQRRLDAAEAEKERMAKTVQRLSGTVTETSTKEYVSALSQAGFKQHPGVLRKIEGYLIRDDAGPALVANFSEDGTFAGEGEGTEKEMSVTEVIQDIFSAFEKDDQGRLKLATQAAEVETPGKEGEGDGGGKPSDKDETDTDLSTEDKLGKIVEDDPEFAELMKRAGVDLTKPLGESKTPVTAGGVEFAEDDDDQEGGE